MNRKIAMLQVPVTADKEANLSHCCGEIRRAAEAGAGMVILPEMFSCPYEASAFSRFAEPKHGRTWQALSTCARENGICLVAGSIPEWEDGKLYNTSFVFDEEGRQLARHRKIHLFDIAVEGGQHFRESDTFTAGEDVTVFDWAGLRFGLCICFDFRFPELARIMALQGAQVLLVPAAFNMTTGPLHWELMFRQRAVDNQCYTIGVAPARDERSPYVSYGNSMACSPWGQVLIRAGAEPETLFLTLEPSQVAEVRQQLPLLKARKPALYQKYLE